MNLVIKNCLIALILLACNHSLAKDYQVLRFDYGKYNNHDDENFLKAIKGATYSKSIENPFSAILPSASLSQCSTDYRMIYSANTGECFENEKSSECKDDLFVLLPCISKASSLTAGDVSVAVNKIREFYGKADKLKGYEYKINYLEATVRIWKDYRLDLNRIEIDAYKNKIQSKLNTQIDGYIDEKDKLIQLKVNLKQYLNACDSQLQNPYWLRCDTTYHVIFS